MPRIRTIRPDFWTDTKMAELTPWARLLYVALWNYVDDEGRGRWLPKAIEGFAFPNDDVDILALLTELSDLERIVPYEVDGTAYFAIPTWHRHQKINRPTYSLIPPPLQLSESSLNPHGVLSDGSLSNRERERDMDKDIGAISESSVSPQGVDPAFERYLNHTETKAVPE